MAEANPSSRWRRYGIRLAQLILTVAVTWFIIDRVGIGLADLREVDARGLRPDWILFTLASLLLLLGFFFSALLWRRMIGEMGGPVIGRGEACRIYFTANLGRYLPGKLWQVAGLALLAERVGVSRSIATGAAILGQAIALGGAAVIGFGAALGAGAPPAGGWALWPLAALPLVLVLLLVPPLFRRLVAGWFRLLRTTPPAGLEIRASFGPRWLALYSVNWLVYVTAFALMVRSLGIDVSVFFLGPAFAAAYVLGYLVLFAPAGMGPREGFLIAFLEPLTGAAAALLVAVVARVWMTFLELAPALLLGGSHLAGRGKRVVKGLDRTRVM